MPTRTSALGRALNASDTNFEALLESHVHQAAAHGAPGWFEN